MNIDNEIEKDKYPVNPVTSERKQSHHPSSTTSQAIRPIAQSYMVAPTFANRIFNQNPHQQYKHNPRNNYESNNYLRFTARGIGNTTTRAPRFPTYGPSRNSSRFSYPYSNSILPISSSTKWVRPVTSGLTEATKQVQTTLPPPPIQIPAVSLNPVVSLSNVPTASELNLNPTHLRNNNITPVVSISKFETPLVVLATNSNVLRNSNASNSLTASNSLSGSGPVKPFIKLDKKLRFRLGNVEKKSANSTTNVVQSIRRKANQYKVDRRINSSRRFSPRRQLLSQSSQNRRRSVDLNRSFTIRKYSMKRIRKLSLSTYSPARHKGLSKYKYNINVKSPKRDLSESQLVELELSSLSQLSNPSVRHATRMVQRSRQLLTKSKQKKNTFCKFYNRFGICKRKETNSCPYLHDLRQVQMCPNFLNGGICAKEECKLSHNLDEGKIPLCTFYNKGHCSRDNCRYRHVPVSPARKNLLNYARIKFTAVGKDIKPTISVSDDTDDHGGGSSRYFEMLPNSQPIVAIIPRRYPKGIISEVGQKAKVSSDDSDEPCSEKDSQQLDTFEVSEVSDSASECVQSDNDEKIKLSDGDQSDSSNSVPVAINDRRSRLLDKVKKIKRGFGFDNAMKSEGAEKGFRDTKPDRNKTNSIMPAFFRF